MTDATGSPSPGRELAAPGRDGRRASGRARSGVDHLGSSRAARPEDARSPSSRSSASSRETRTARSGSPGRRRGREPASGCAVSSPRQAPRSPSTPPGTSGSRSAASRSARSSSAATSTPCRTAAGSTARSTSSPAPRCCDGSPREGTPPVTLRLVNWADEEGARFGRSLFGSSAAAGSMSDQDELRQLTDRDGTTLPDALAAYGVDLDSALDARTRARLGRCLPRAAHRAGPRPRVARPAPRRRARDVRRRAPSDHLARAGGARRLDADGAAP